MPTRSIGPGLRVQRTRNGNALLEEFWTTYATASVEQWFKTVELRPTTVAGYGGALKLLLESADESTTVDSLPALVATYKKRANGARAFNQGSATRCTKPFATTSSRGHIGRSRPLESLWSAPARSPRRLILSPGGCGGRCASSACGRVST